MKSKQEIDAINIQVIALFLALISSVISIITTYNQKLETENKKTFLNSKQSYYLTLANRVLILILALIFLYINYVLYTISKEEDEDLKPYRLQIWASVFTITSAAIALYVVTLSGVENVADVENPII